MSSDQNPLVSIVLPVYNGEKYLKQSLESCTSQTYKNIEVIVVNDCSTDASLAIAEACAAEDARIRIINNTANQRLPATLNVGHIDACGSYISWTSDDNFYHPDAIATLVTALQENNATVAISGYNMIEEDGTLRREVHPATDTHIVLGNSVGASFLYAKEVFDKNDGYNEDLHTVEDYDFWLRASLHSTYTYVPQILYSYRVHSESLTAQIEAGSTPFDVNLQKSYAAFFYQMNQSSLADYFYKLHRNKEINLAEFLDNFEPVASLLTEKFGSNFGATFKDFTTALDLKLRIQMLSFSANQNRKTLLQIMKKRPKLLTGYERKRSANYIKKSLF